MTLTHAMILAAGRGERMRPLTDATPKPLLMAGGKRLIEWQIERLAAAGVQHIVINHAWLGEQFETTLGTHGQFQPRYGCTLWYSAETTALETAGGIAKALPLLSHNNPTACCIVVSGDIYTNFDYATLPQAVEHAHLVLVANPYYHPSGDMVLTDGVIAPKSKAVTQTLTYANIGVFRTSMFETLDPTRALKLFPWLYTQGAIHGQYFNGVWHNVGTPSQLASLNAVLKT